MSKPLIGKKVACLAANGFSEQDVLKIQELVCEAGASFKFICPNMGLVSGWTGQSWGRHFAVDKALSESLGADYDFLFIPSGHRSIDKLKISAHTKRFLNSFLSANKPTILYGDAVKLLIYYNYQDYMISGPSELKQKALELGNQWSDHYFSIDHGLFTSYVTSENTEELSSEALNFLLNFELTMIEAA